ncbi:hypothetical protein HDV01_000211 [Terramyces sp. JEL0728]|nr:hypothetical protein HDV01_000211 [Terramyces sp. JEL0728]
MVYYKVIARFYNILESISKFIKPEEIYWKQKCMELQEQNKQLLVELSQERESRAIVDKLYINAKARIEEREMQLEDFLSKELEMCQGCQKFTSEPEFIEYQDEIEEEMFDFEEQAKDTVTQLLVSHSTANSICINLADLALKTDATDLDCVRIALIAIVDYLTQNEKLNAKEETHLLYDIGIVSVASILKYLEKNNKDTAEWLQPGLASYMDQVETAQKPSAKVQISWAPVRSKREYYVPSDDDVETETIIYDQEELEIEFVNE